MVSFKNGESADSFTSNNDESLLNVETPYVNLMLDDSNIDMASNITSLLVTFDSSKMYKPLHVYITYKEQTYNVKDTDFALTTILRLSSFIRNIRVNIGDGEFEAKEILERYGYSSNYTNTVSNDTREPVVTNNGDFIGDLFG